MYPTPRARLSLRVRSIAYAASYQGGPPGQCAVPGGLFLCVGGVQDDASDRRAAEPRQLKETLAHDSRSPRGRAGRPNKRKPALGISGGPSKLCAPLA